MGSSWVMFLGIPGKSGNGFFTHGFGGGLPLVSPNGIVGLGMGDGMSVVLYSSFNLSASFDPPTVGTFGEPFKSVNGSGFSTMFPRPSKPIPRMLIPPFFLQPPLPPLPPFPPPEQLPLPSPLPLPSKTFKIHLFWPFICQCIC